MSDIAARINGNVTCIRQRIAEAAARSGRAASQITLVAVTKYVSAELARQVIAAGCRELAESRPQQLWEKAAALGDLPIRWHMVGHLQRNKIRRTLPLVAMIHSIDSLRLLEAIDADLAASPFRAPTEGWTGEGRGDGKSPLLSGEGKCEGRSTLPLLLEVNVSGEQAKHGFAPEAIEPLLASLPDYRHVAVRGLMCMAGLEGDLDAACRDFDALRGLRDRLRPNCPQAVSLDELSMGMSGDFEVAIEQGATIVRIGSALFEGVMETN
jgi:PLP dependent protein